MNIFQVEDGKNEEIQAFLDLPFSLYRDCPQWVPPLASEAGSQLDRRHPFYRHSDAAFFLVRESTGPAKLAGASSGAGAPA